MTRDSGGRPRLGIAVFLVIGLMMAGYGAYSYSSQSEAVDSTETVDATVVSTSVEHSPERQATSEYSPRATFNYTYEGETYTSSKVYPAGTTQRFSNEGDARAELAGYEPGETVTAHVPTDSPANAFLKDETTDRPLIFGGAGALLVLGSLALAVRERFLT